MNIDNIEPITRDNFRTVRPIEQVAAKHIPSKTVYPTGIEAFDKALDGGFRDGELIVVSGRTGEGKSLFCQSLTFNFSKQKVPTLWFSYEMSPFYLLERFRKHTPFPPHFLTYVPTDLNTNSLKFIEDKIKEAYNEYACKIVFIDHLHFLIPLQQSGNSSLMIGGIMRKLKLLALKLNVIIVLIAHTKKIYEDETLSLSSIRDSSLISQEADYVFLIERLKAEQGGKLDNVNSDWTDKSKVALAKNRRTGQLLFLKFYYNNGILIPDTFEQSGQSDSESKLPELSPDF